MADCASSQTSGQVAIEGWNVSLVIEGAKRISLQRAAMGRKIPFRSPAVYGVSANTNAVLGRERPMTRSWVHFTRGRFVRQARVGLGDVTEEHLSRQGFAGP